MFSKLRQGRNGVAALFLLLASCSIMGEKYVVLKASVQVSKASAGENVQCILSLHNAEDGSSIDWRRVGLIFEEGFLVSPFSSEYYIAVECEEIGAVKSPPFAIGEDVRFGEVIDLGQFEIVDSS